MNSFLLVSLAVFTVVHLGYSSPAPSGLLRYAIPHNLYDCDPSKAKVKVLERLIQKSGKAGYRIEENIQFPKIGVSANPIACISIEDLSRNGKGGYPDIVAGGVNYNYVSIAFESQLSESLQFLVTIYTGYGNRVPVRPIYYGNQVPQGVPPSLLGSSKNQSEIQAV